MTSPRDLAERLYPFSYGITGPGNDAAADIMCAELPFTVHEFPSGSTMNGWLIPHHNDVKKAQIRENGALVYDALQHPLGVAAQSAAFTGTVDRKELLQHIAVAEEDPDWIPYHWSFLYRPWQRDWQFCMPRRLRDSLGAGPFEVELEIEEQPWPMRVLDYTLPGTSPQTVLINAHNCHAFQANDDTSGVAVGIALMQRLAEAPRRLTYRLLIAPELQGPMFWLDAMPASERRNLMGALLLKSVGNRRDLRLQESFSGTSRMDRAAHHVLRARLGDYDHGPFRSIYGNDETVFEAPPYRIPSITLTRWPFREYHSDADTPERLSATHLDDCMEAAFELCLALEADVAFLPRFEGLVNLSSRNLYKTLPPYDPDSGVDYHQTPAGRWNRLMNSLPQLMDGKTRLLDIAEDYDLPIAELREYLSAWEKEGLAAPVDPANAQNAGDY